MSFPHAKVNSGIKTDMLLLFLLDNLRVVPRWVDLAIVNERVGVKSGEVMCSYSMPGYYATYETRRWVRGNVTGLLHLVFHTWPTLWQILPQLLCFVLGCPDSCTCCLCWSFNGRKVSRPYGQHSPSTCRFVAGGPSTKCPGITSILCDFCRLFEAMIVVRLCMSRCQISVSCRDSRFLLRFIVIKCRSCQVAPFVTGPFNWSP